MKTTPKNLLVDITNTAHGMLEQGGFAGRIVSYPINDAMRVTELTLDQLETSSPNRILRPHGEPITIIEALQHHLGPGKVFRKGIKIQ